MREYEDTFTTALMQSGLPKMMSRVLTCLYTTDAGSLTASELVQHLQVSPASISKAITFLESQDLIRRERDERRRERYIVDDHVWYQAMIASARSTAQLVGTARQGVGILGPGTPAAARLENIARFLQLRRREHHPRRGAGPRGPVHQSRSDLTQQLADARAAPHAARRNPR